MDWNIVKERCFEMIFNEFYFLCFIEISTDISTVKYHNPYADLILTTQQHNVTTCHWANKYLSLHVISHSLSWQMQVQEQYSGWSNKGVTKSCKQHRELLTFDLIINHQNYTIMFTVTNKVHNTQSTRVGCVL